MNTKMLCLGVLTLGDASGYDIGKTLEQTFSKFVEVASSGVYPALKTLYEDGLVDYRDQEQVGLPNKKIYSLTAAGKKKFRDELMELPPRHKIRSQFILLLFFADKLSENRLQDVVRERIQELRHWTDLTSEWLNSSDSNNCDSHCNQPSQNFIARYALEVMGTEIRFLENNLESLLADLRKSGQSGEDA